ncbi:hypothetical protein OIV83_000586 [Microbotryomycetes sp. JL201]|nr:hypothetical protein OIV83_000586 [Microbotryomycetes sp. JL201]
MSDLVVHDWSRLISKQGRSWQPSAIRGLFPLENIPGMVSFLAGKPNSETFPFSSLKATIKPVVPGGKEEEIIVQGSQLSEGLQYGPTPGLQGLVKWLEVLQERKHNRAKDKTWRVSVGSGSQDLLNKAMCSLVDPGDSILMESPCYPGTLGLLTPLEANLVEVPTDNNGLNVDALEEVLDSWSTKRPNERFPKMLYTIPTGSNPSGCSAPQDRKERVLALARKHDFVIMEDDAYAFLAFDTSKQAPSYFELEARDLSSSLDGANGYAQPQVGRVLRFDTFSKILSSGMRIGFVTGPPQIVDVLDLMTSNTNLQPNTNLNAPLVAILSSTTAAIALALLNKWGIDGFFEHTKRVAKFYDEKRAMFERIAHKHLDGLATWLYLNLKLTEDGSAGDSFDLIANTAVEKGVLAVPGKGFSPTGAVSSCVRVSYSLATEEDAELGFARLAECVREARAKNKQKEQ